MALVAIVNNIVSQRFPAFWPWVVLICGLLGTGPQSRRWVSGEGTKLPLYLQPFLIACITSWAQSSIKSMVAFDSHRSLNPALNCACEGSRLHAPFENHKSGLALEEPREWEDYGLRAQAGVNLKWILWGHYGTSLWRCRSVLTHWHSRDHFIQFLVSR